MHFHAIGVYRRGFDPACIQNHGRGTRLFVSSSTMNVSKAGLLGDFFSTFLLILDLLSCPKWHHHSLVGSTLPWMQVHGSDQGQKIWFEMDWNRRCTFTECFFFGFPLQKPLTRKWILKWLGFDNGAAPFFASFLFFKSKGKATDVHGPIIQNWFKSLVWSMDFPQNIHPHGWFWLTQQQYQWSQSIVISNVPKSDKHIGWWVSIFFGNSKRCGSKSDLTTMHSISPSLDFRLPSISEKNVQFKIWANMILVVVTSTMRNWQLPCPQWHHKTNQSK